MGSIIALATAALNPTTLLIGFRALNKKGNTFESSDPAVLWERGSPIPYLLGFDSLPGNLSWEKYKYTANETFAGGAGGKGIGSGSGGENQVEYRQGQHIVCIGPARRLRRIIQNGKVIWPLRGQHQFGITPDTSPSGSGFDCRNAENGGSEGHFRWYWGERDQPVDPLFASGIEKTIATNDGFVCYAVWDAKRLAGPATWPVVEFEVEVSPYSHQMLYSGGASWDPETVAPLLSGSSPWIGGYPAADESKMSLIYETFTSPTAVNVYGDKTADYPSGQLCELRNTNYDGTYECASSVFTAGSSTLPHAAIREIGSNLNAVNSFGTTLFLSSSLGGSAGGINSGTTGFPTFPGYGIPDDIFVMRNRLTRNAGSNDLYVDILANDPGPYVPLDSGGTRRLGTGTHVFTIYLWKQIADSYRFKMGFNITGGSYKSVELEKGPTGAMTVIASSTGITFVESHISPAYVMLQVKYAVLSGEVGMEYSQRIELHDGVSGTTSYNFKYLACARGSGIYPFFGHTTRIEGSGGKTKIELIGVPGPLSEFEGRIFPMTLSSEVVSGANLAHVIYQILTLPRPHGVGDLSSIIEPTSIEALGALLESEELRSHYLVTKGNRHQNILERALYEALINCQWDATVGKWRFEALRPKAADFKLDPKMIVSNDADVVGTNSSSKTSRIVYRYRDMLHNMTPQTVTVREDGVAEDILGPTLERVDLDSVRDSQTAATVARRLYLIESTSPVLIQVGMCRDAHALRVGDFVDCQQVFNEYYPLMVKSIAPVAGNREVAIGLVSTPFSQAPQETQYAVVSPPLVSEIAPDPDFAQRVFELSGHLTEEVTFIALRIPTGDRPTKSVGMFSREGVVFETVGTIEPSTGGYVVGELADPSTGVLDYWGQEDAASVTQADGPTLLVSDPNFPNKIRVLSDEQLASGDQWLIVGREVMFVRRFDPLGDGLWQAKDVIRGRYEHGIEPYLTGLVGYVVQKNALPILRISPEAMNANAEIRMISVRKDVATSLGDAVSLKLSSQALAVSPVFVGDLQNEGPVIWNNAIPVSLSWRYANSRSMYMAKAANVPAASFETFEGRFFVDVYNQAAPTISVLQVEGDGRGTVSIDGADIENALTLAGQPSDSDLILVLSAVGRSGVLATISGTGSVFLNHGTI